MKNIKRQTPRMPRKMKKRFKKLMAFFDERRTEYEKNKFLLTYGFLILEHLKTLGISPEDVEDITLDDTSNIFVKLKGSIRTAEITINVEEGAENENN